MEKPGLKTKLVKRTPTVGEAWNGIIREYRRANEELEKNLNAPSQTYHEGYVAGLYASLHFVKAVVYGEKVKLPPSPSKPLDFDFKEGE